MTISAIDGGAYICRESGWTTTQLAVQKILYLAHMVHFGRTNAPLVQGQFEAWEYGPVHPLLYQRVKAFGAKPIPDVYPKKELHGQAVATLSDACSNLLGKSAAELVRNTHWHGGAWIRHYIPGARNVPIPDASIIDEYKRRTE